MSQLLQHLINGIASGTIYALIALGYTMVYGVLKLINFAHGDVMMVGVYMGYATAFALGREARSSVGGVLLIFLVAMGGCALLGFLIERFAYRPLRDKPRLTALITAIGISFTLSYGFQLDIGFLPGSAPRAFPQVIKPAQWFTLGDPEFPDVVLWNWQVISLVVAVALMMGLQFLVYRTRFGRAMRAVSFDHRVAALMGIPTDRVISVTFMIGSALAAGAGLLYAIKDTSVSPLMGLYVGLKAFVAAVIGGIGNISGAMLGGLLIGFVEIFGAAYFSPHLRDVYVFSLLIAVLLLRPTGLLGRATVEKV